MQGLFFVYDFATRHGVKTAKEKDEMFVLFTHNQNHTFYFDGNVLLLNDGRNVTQVRCVDIVMVDFVSK